MLEEEVVKALKQADVEAFVSELEAPAEAKYGDVAYPCFKLARQTGKSPNELAKEITEKIRIPEKSSLASAEVVGGYVNFFFDWEKLAGKVLQDALEKHYGRAEKIKKEKIMVEFSQPNPVHPMHVGHARTTFLGESLSNILELQGHKVFRTNYMNDVGLQVAKLVTAYNLWGKGKEPKGKPDFWLWQYYVKFHEESKSNPELEQQAHENLKKFELEKDKAISKIWKQITKWCIQGFEETYKKVGIKFDEYFFESEFRDDGKKLVDKLLKNNFAHKTDDGAIVADLEKFGIPSTVILRSDGTGLYITSDLGLTAHKFSKYKLNKSIWVVSSQQNLNFKQLFKLLELLGYSWYKNCFHVSFEHVVLPEGKMSSREGRAVMLDEVIEALTKSALKEVKKRDKKLSEEKAKEIAEKIAIGALKYSVVRIEPNDQIVFDWNQMLSFTGNTGPYLQYAHTRCAGILERSGNFLQEFSVDKISSEEKNLLKQIMMFPNVISQSAKEMKPHIVCNYLYELATIFNNFYESVPVLKSEGSMKNFRLTLVQATKNVLRIGLNLIGVEAPDKM